MVWAMSHFPGGGGEGGQAKEKTVNSISLDMGYTSTGKVPCRAVNE